MEKISFDSGMRQFHIGQGGILRFNPADPGVYARFMECGEKLREIEKELMQKAGEGKGLHLLSEADRKLKRLLSWVFGAHNDFDEILGGVSLLAKGENGQRVIVNLLSALQPVMVEGAKACAQEILAQAQNHREGQA